MVTTGRHLVTLGLALAALLIGPTVLAHGGEEGSADAADLTNQAIAFLQADPPNTMAAEERINDALTAEEAPDDVNLTLVQAANLAVGEGATPEAVALLNRALGQQGEPTGPIVNVSIGPGTYLAFAAAALLIGLGAFGLGRRARTEAATTKNPTEANNHG